MTRTIGEAIEDSFITLACARGPGRQHQRPRFDAQQLAAPGSGHSRAVHLKDRARPARTPTYPVGGEATARPRPKATPSKT